MLANQDPKDAEELVFEAAAEAELVKESSFYLGSLQEGLEKLNHLPEADFQFQRQHLLEELKNTQKWIVALENSLLRQSRRLFLKKIGEGTIIAATTVPLFSCLANQSSKMNRVLGYFENYFGAKEITRLKEQNILLTIDDGPRINDTVVNIAEETSIINLEKGRKLQQEILKYLTEHKIKAVFFWVGSRLEVALRDYNYRSQMINLVRKGFIVGNHCFTHQPIFNLNAGEIISEIERTDKLIEELYRSAGVLRPIKLLRFPYRSRPKLMYKEEVYTFLNNLGYVIMYWSKDTKDWEHQEVKQIDIELKNCLPGDIILIHENPRTLKFLSRICEQVAMQELELTPLV